MKISDIITDERLSESGWKKAVAAGIVGATLAGPMAHADENNGVSNKELWRRACMLVKENGFGSCKHVPMPDIVYAREITNKGFRAFFDGDHTIYVKLDQTGDIHDALVVHEMTHYILDYTGVLPLPGSEKDACQSEKDAFKVKGDYFAGLGYKIPDSVIQWKKQYPECNKYKLK